MLHNLNRPTETVQIKPKSIVRKNNDIFDDNDVIQEIGKDARNAPKVREKATIKIGFTEKKFPTLAARETYLKEPPLPKSAQSLKSENVRRPAMHNRKACRLRRRTRCG
jgi:hypothetical protein